MRLRFSRPRHFGGQSKGVEEQVGWYRGVAGGTVRRYSDVLLIFLLKALRPERYRERVDVRGVLAHLDVSLLPDDLVARLADGENPVTVLAPILRGQLQSGETETNPPTQPTPKDTDQPPRPLGSPDD